MIEEQLGISEEQANQLREQSGGLSNEIEKLELGAEHANQLQRLEEKRASMQQLVDQYAVAAFTSLLFKKARELYEKERQPAVLLRASEYLARLTNGRYTHIKAPFGEQRLVALKADGQAVDTGFLSRGTAEQLYLAMRFALIEEYGRRTSLPLIMDDILVNFDQQRMESCLRIMAELSGKHQILLFTCHQHVFDAVRLHFPQFHCIEL
ncbi:DNA replication and repair protein RecF [compost metagenome]